MAIPGEMNDDEIKEKLAIADNLIREGKIFSADTELLEIALLGLCDQRAGETHTIKEINKGILFTSILMERRNQKTNKLILFLAVVGIIVGMAEVFLSLIGLCR